jgi:hypothetical protein
MAGLVKKIALLTGRWREERVLVFGNDAAGKTTLLYRLKLGELVTTIPTIGFNVETIPHGKCDFTMWDVGGKPTFTVVVVFINTDFSTGCDRLRPLYRHYVNADSIQLFVHSCTETEGRVDESIEELHANIKMMHEVGSRFIFILFNKQDLLPEEKRASIVDGLQRRFEKELSRYSRTDVVCTILDLPGFSAFTGNRVHELLDPIQAVLDGGQQHGRKQRRKDTPSSVPTAESPPESELVARISKEGMGETDADTFWAAFLSSDIPEWNHRTHLRAGYIALLETLKEGKGIFDAAEMFLDHLRRLKEAKPERFRNTEHRTMTIFWLYFLQLAILDFKHNKSVEKWPAWDSFQEVLLHSPHLMNGGLWKGYYSKDLLFSPEAKEYWRLPDLQALPDFTQITATKTSHHIRQNSNEEPYRVMRFAFSVVQKYMSSNVRRGWMVKQALASLQSTTMRLRAKNPSIPPYSETQAYFWIQLIHAALVSESLRPPTKATTDELSLRIPLTQLSFSSFRVLFDIEPTTWKLYYKPKTWDSIEARMEFVNPDLKALPNVLNIPSFDHVGRALSRQMDSAKIGMAGELPSMEDLAFRAAIVMEDSKTVPNPASAEITNHSQLLVYLYSNLIAASNTAPTTSPASQATTVLMKLSGPYITSFTQKSFWTQQVLGASTRDQQSHNKSPGDTLPPTFENFLKENLHLVYEDLPLCYYSPELLRSYEAKEAFVAPDKRKMKAYFAIKGKEEEDEWVVL